MKIGFVYMLIGALISGSAIYYVMKKQNTDELQSIKIQKLHIAESAVKSRLKTIESKLTDQLTAFSEAVSVDKNFSMKMFVENDLSSPDIVDIAGRYLKAMDFSVLEVTDSSGTFVSSGHFPANSGQNISEQIAALSSRPIAIKENIMGNQVLTLQSKKTFEIADFRFSAIGGYEINSKLLKELSPWDEVTVLLQKGNDYIGMNDIRSISEIKDNSIIINDKEYYATRIPFSSANEQSELSLLVIINK
jgi:hypothetical protein